MDGFTAEASARLREHSWPGNLRELSNAIERAVIMARDRKIAPADLPMELRAATVANAAADPASPVQTGLPISLEQLEEAHIRGVLATAKSLADAAVTLGIDQATLYRKRKKMGLE